MIKKSIKYLAISSVLATGISCTDQLRIDERQRSFDVNYFTYSRYQLTSAIVNTFKSYGSAVTDAPKGQATLYFMDCYSSDLIGGYYTRTDQNWDFQGSNPYTNQLRTLAALSNLAANEDNQATVAAADILKCVIGAYMTEKYGDIPFSEAVSGREGNLFPKFDSQKEVYEVMLGLLDRAVATLSNSASKGLPSDHDVLFKGDKAKWVKFANSLKLRLMMHSYDAFKKGGRDFAAEIAAIASGNNYMSSVSDNAALDFNGIDQAQSWYLQRKWGTGNEFTEQKPTKYLIDQMVSFDDPRMYVIFAPVLSPVSSKTEAVTENVKINGYTYAVDHYPSSLYQPSDLEAAGRDLNGEIISVKYPLDAKWVGTPNPQNVHLQYAGSGLPGTNSFYDNRRITGFSQLISQTHGNELKAVVMEASETLFLLAEARQRGIINVGTVKDYYDKGIKLSFERWGITNGTKPASHLGSDKIIDNFDAYCNQPGVALDGTAADLDKIGTQKWLSLLVTNHTEAYTDIKRTGKPAFAQKIASSFSQYDFPTRYKYPLDESSNNKDAYNAAVTSLGGRDLPSSKMWILQ
jgi:hypothetical protein